MSDSTPGVNKAEGRTAPRLYREFITSISQGDPDRHCGFGVTVEDVYGFHQDIYESYWETFDREVADGRRRTKEETDPVRYAAEWPDMVVWDRLQAVALIYPHPGGERRLLMAPLAKSAPPRDGPGNDPDAARPEVQGQAQDVLIYRHKAAEGPYRSFRVVAENGTLFSIHEGQGLTLDRVVEGVVEECSWADKEFWGDESHDLTVVCDRRVACVIRRDATAEGFHRVLYLNDAPGPARAPEAPRVSPQLAELIGKFAACSVRQAETEDRYNANPDGEADGRLEKEFDDAQDDFVAAHEALSAELEAAGRPYVVHGGTLVVDTRRALARPDITGLNLFAFHARPPETRADEAKGGGR